MLPRPDAMTTRSCRSESLHRGLHRADRELSSDDDLVWLDIRVYEIFRVTAGIPRGVEVEARSGVRAQTLDRALDVLDILADGHARSSHDLAAATGLHRSIVYRALWKIVNSFGALPKPLHPGVWDCWC
jgi:IclR helix-turn-helix domain